MEQSALVFSGGGSRGSYEIGVWRALTELGERFSIVTGSSVGALNGAMVLQGDYTLAERLWSELETAQVFSLDLPDDSSPDLRMRAVLKSFSTAVRRGGLDFAPLEALLRSCLDETRVRASGMRLGLATLRIQRIQPEFLWLEEIPDGLLYDYLLASSSLFPAIRPRKIGGDHYIDGAFADNMPVQMAVDAGAKKIVAVRLDAPGLMRPVRRDNGIFLREIHSWWDLGKILLFDPACARKNIRLGYLDTMRAYHAYEGCAYALLCGSGKKLLRSRYLPHMEEILRLYSGRGAQTGERTTSPALGRLASEAVTGAFQKRIQKRGLLCDGKFTKDQVLLGNESPVTLFFLALALDGLECAGELFGVDPLTLYSLERFEESLWEAIEEDRSQTASSGGERSAQREGTVFFEGASLKVGREGRSPRAAVFRYARRLARWMRRGAQEVIPPPPGGLSVQVSGGLARGESGFAAAVYLALFFLFHK